MPIIRIKRSGTSASPASLAQGELAYSYLAGTQSNGGDRLYIGTGTETGGVAANIEVIGGKYFTQMLDHVAGTLTASSAVIVDSNNKIDIFNVDNLTLNDNTLSATNTNGSIVLAPNGTGVVDVSGKKITNLAAPTANTDAVTLGYLNTSFTSNLNIVGDSGTDAVSLLTDTLDFAGGTGVTTAVTDNTVTFNIGQDVGTTAAVNFGSVATSGNVTVGGNLIVNGNTTFVNVQTLEVEDALIRLAANNTTDAVDIGFIGRYINGANTEHAGLFRDASDGQFYLFRSYQDSDITDNVINRGDATFNLATLNATSFVGALTGNATTATTLQTARTINGVSFNGSANITITANTPNALTFNNGGAGAASGTTFNGSAAQTISYNTIGASPLAGSTSLTTLGTITTGTWNGSVIGATYGGTGVNNGSNTITLGGNISTAAAFTTAGAFALTLTTTASTNVTLPTTGTLATLGGTETFSGAKTFSAAVTFSGTTVNYALGTSQSTGTFTIGGPSQTGAITIGQSTAAQTLNLATGATLNATTKTVNIGTGGAAGSTTNINIGSSVAGTTTVNSPTLVATTVNATTFTGALSGNATTASALQTARTITLSGDVTGSTSFDGSTNVTLSVSYGAVDGGTY